jgi:hypothetical protein
MVNKKTNCFREFFANFVQKLAEFIGFQSRPIEPKKHPLRPPTSGSSPATKKAGAFAPAHSTRVDLERETNSEFTAKRTWKVRSRRVDETLRLSKVR